MSLYVRAVGVSRNQSAEQLVATCEAIIKGLTDNPAFPNPPVDLKTLRAAVDGLSAALAAQVHGGMAATAEKKNRQAELILIMRKLRHYVEDNCGNDIAVLLSSGFQSAASTRLRSPIANPSILGIDRGNSDELMLKVTPIARAKCYEVRSAVVSSDRAPGPWHPTGLFTSSRITIGNLVPTTTYMFQVRAVGAAGNTEWSDPVSHMCA